MLSCDSIRPALHSHCMDPWTYFTRLASMVAIRAVFAGVHGAQAVGDKAAAAG
jgi:hypothetical protein